VMGPVSAIYSKSRKTVLTTLCLISVATWTQSQNSRSPSHLLLVWEVQCPFWICQRFGETSESAHLILSCLSWSGAASIRAWLPSRLPRLASDRDLGDLLQHLIETTGRGSQRLDVFLRHLFAAGLFLRMHDARYPVSHIGLPIIVGIGRHRPAAKPYHGSEEARVRFVGLEPSEIRRSAHTAL
jgi:hypothetical protein